MIKSLVPDGLYDCTWSENNERHLLSSSGDGSIKVPAPSPRTRAFPCMRPATHNLLHELGPHSCGTLGCRLHRTPCVAFTSTRTRCLPVPTFRRRVAHMRARLAIRPLPVGLTHLRSSLRPTAWTGISWPRTASSRAPGTTPSSSGLPNGRCSFLFRVPCRRVCRVCRVCVSCVEWC
jgi:hypothetical protein